MALVELDDLISPAEAAKIAGLTPQSIINKCEAGKLRYVRCALGRLIFREDVEQLKRGQETRK